MLSSATELNGIASSGSVCSGVVRRSAGGRLRRAIAVPRQLLAIVRHPLNLGRTAEALGRWARWQLASRLAAAPLLVPFAGNTRLVARAGETGVTGNIFFGLAEYEEMAFTVHLLRPLDLFIDVGANAGTYAVLASGVAGARTVAFEPIPTTADRLDMNVRLNGLADRIVAHRLGVGATPGELRFTADEDTTNHAAAPGEAGIPVKVDALDRVLAGKSPVLIKIDTEGFESEVLAGAAKTLTAPSLLAVIVETNGMGERYGRGVENVVVPLERAGFAPVAYDPTTRKLERLAGANPASNNTIFVRDLAQASERLGSAPPFKVAGNSL